MASPNPYQSPQTDVTAPPMGGVDQTGPFDPKGRFGRLSYIAWGMAINFFAAVIQVIIGLLIALVTGVTESASMGMAGGGIAMVLNLAFSLVVMVLTIIFFIRRLHDINLSGWWVLFSFIAGAVAGGLIAAGVTTQSTMLLIVGVVAAVFPFGFGIFVLVKPGTEGPNRFGPPRETRGWEQVVGIIGVVLIVLSVVVFIGAIIAVLASPELMQQWSQTM